MQAKKDSEKISLVEKARQAIENQLLNGKLKPEQHLVETDLAEKLGISRTPLREALRQLEIKGLVEKRHAMGYVVVYHSLKDIRNNFEVRLPLESAAIRLACENATKENINRASTFLARYDEELASPGKAIDIDHFFNSDRDWNSLFHREMYNAAGNELLTAYIMNLRNLDQLKRIAFSLRIQDYEVFQDQHYKILNAVKQRDKGKAEKAVQAHIRTLYGYYIAVSDYSLRT